MRLPIRSLAVCVVLASAVLFFAGARPAFACSCAAPLPTVAPSAGNAVFVGTVTAKRFAWWRLFRAGTDYRYRVEGVVSGDVHETVSVTAKKGPSASCGGFAARVGDRTGVTAQRLGGRWKVNLCSAFDAADVLAMPGVHPPARGASPGPAVSARLLDLAGWIVGGIVVVGLVLRSRRARSRARYGLDRDPWGDAPIR